MPRALVTGATGLVGAHIVEHLLAGGWRVGAMVRRPAAAAWLRELGADLHAGDILDGRAFTGAARGADVIFHAAAAITPAGGWEAYRAPNIDGTRNAIRAASESGARLLQVSSVAVYGPTARYGADAGGTTEDTPLQPLGDGQWYARSKRESEALALEAHGRGEVWATAIRPDVIYGRRDRQFVPRMARALRLGVAPLPGGGGTTLAVVHAANVADAAVLAATTDVAGGRAYNVANDFDVTVARFMQLAAEGMGRTLHIVRVPLPLARAGIAAARLGLRLVGAGGVAAMFDGSTGFVTLDNPFNSDRARRELGWSPRVTPEVGVPDAFRWAVERRRDGADRGGAPGAGEDGRTAVSIAATSSTSTAARAATDRM
ncbi:MAG: NAD-dependent epimerase/dehydratase family protein [Gemmatimonadaceae bacterium]